MPRIRRGILAVGLAGAVTAGAVPPMVGSAAADEPAGHVIAFLDANPARVTTGVHLHDVQSGETRHILAGVRAAMPALSPDGTRIAYAADGPDPGGVVRGLQLWVAPTDESTPPVQLNPGYCTAQAPAWSADGQWIAYGCRSSGSQVSVVDSTTGAPKTPSGPAGGDPSFSPDGSKLVVSGAGGRMTVIDLSGETEPVALGTGSQPVWSPDGAEILYASIEMRRRLWAVRPDGTGARLLAGATPAVDDSVGSWAWSADSRTIVFAGFVVDPVYDSRGPSDVWLIDRAGLRRWQVGETPDVHEANVSVSGSLHASVPAPPTLVSASANVNQAAAHVTWAPPASDGGAPVTGYEVEVRTTPDGAPVRREPVHSGTSGLIDGLTFGQTYYFGVTAANAAGVGLSSSLAGPVTPRAATRTAITAIPSSYLYGRGAVSVAGSVVRVDPGGPAAGAVVQLQYRPVGTAAFRTVTSATADAQGRVSFGGYRPGTSVEYRLVTLASGAYLGSSTPGRVVPVHAAISIGLTRADVVRGTATSVVGTVSPSVSGRQVVLQQWTGASWRSVASSLVRPDSTYAFAFRPGRPGRHAYRVGLPPSGGLALSYSGAVTLTVR